MRKRLSALILLMLAALLVSALPAFAGFNVIRGTLGTNVLPNGRFDDNSNDCNDTLDNSETFTYTQLQFYVTASGDYDYRDIGSLDDLDDEGTIDVWMGFYTGTPAGFNPSEPRGNGCFANFDDTGTLFLQAGVIYTVMISNYDDDYLTGSWIISLNGPGDVVLIDGSNPLRADGRINPQQNAPIIAYCDGETAEFYSVTGHYQGSVANGETGTFGTAQIRPTADGRMEISAGLPDGKTYLFIYDGCARGSYEAYTVENGVPTLFDRGVY